MKEKVLEKIIINLNKNRVKTHDDLWRLVSQISRQNRMPSPSTSELLKIFRKLALPHLSSPSREGEAWRGLEKLLCKRPMRTLSGVAIITVLTKPFKCPGRCIYCPNEPGMPKSYLKNEPAAARAKLNKFDPYKQVKMRLETLKANGHPTDKIELIIKGGSWNAYPKNYREWFVRKCFESCNTFSENKKLKIKNKKHIRKNIKTELEVEQKKNEIAAHRIIGLTIETRPDLITPLTSPLTLRGDKGGLQKEIFHLRKIGCTRVELGVQTIYDDILKRCHRGHSVKETIRATKLLKDAGFKVDYHLMPGLPGSSFQKDIKMFEKIFTNPDFMPDTIKIYPCAVMPNTPLYNLWKRGKYKPLGGKQLVKMLVKVKSEIIPRFCRIARLIRDIPSPSIAAGNKITNLREYIKREMERRNLRCKCLRCREIGHAKTESRKLKAEKLFIEKYAASDGTEYFLSFEDEKRETVYAFLRLRFPDKTFIPELKNSAIIRELHTYGHLVPIGKGGKIQHAGFGKKLMAKAEKIAKNAKFKKVAVISGVGVREYYKKLGYKLEGTYMVKYF